jgi:hypothetical protein
MRKTQTVTIAAEGRDKGKVFVITEMPARQVERWERRALAAMVRTGIEIPDNIKAAGFGYVLAMGLKALIGLNGPEVEALHDELMACVKIQPDPTREFTREVLDEEIEEDRKIYTLKDEVIKLHSGFSIAAYLSRLWGEAAQMAAASLNTSTSIPSSGPSSPEG